MKLKPPKPGKGPIKPPLPSKHPANKLPGVPTGRRPVANTAVGPAKPAVAPPVMDDGATMPGMRRRLK